MVADGARLLVRAAVADLVCFAWSWHWLNEQQRCGQVARVLCDGGRWAAWWSHARADDTAWFNTYWSEVERVCSGSHRDQRRTDWGATVDPALLEISHHSVVEWTREDSVNVWMADQASHSYMIGSAPGVVAVPRTLGLGVFVGGWGGAPSASCWLRPS